MTETSSAASACNTRDDLSLLVRKFNAKLSSRRKKSGHNSGSDVAALASSPTAAAVDTLSGQMVRVGDTMKVGGVHPQPRPSAAKHSSTTTTTTATEESSEPDAAFATKTSAGRELPLDEDGRIKPYVDFSYFHAEYDKWCKLQEQQAK